MNKDLVVFILAMVWVLPIVATGIEFLADAYAKRGNKDAT